MKYYYAETGMGACIRVAENIDSARKQILREVGTANGIQIIREATKFDIDRVTVMGGLIPELPKAARRARKARR